jgi:hypothetical protein
MTGGDSQTAEVHAERWLRLAVAIFLIMAVLYGAWIVWRMFLPLELEDNEPWNGWQAQAAMGARALYPAKDALIVNNYPPLSFYLVGGLSRVLSVSPIFAGR